MTTAKTKVATLLAGAVLAGGGAVAAVAPPADAACKGKNERELVSLATQTDTETYSVKVDSCRASKMVNDFGNAKDAAGLAGMLGAKWWPAGAASGVFFGWAWNNQSEIKGCESKHTGIKFKEINGMITSCSAQ